VWSLFRLCNRSSDQYIKHRNQNSFCRVFCKDTIKMIKHTYTHVSTTYTYTMILINGALLTWNPLASLYRRLYSSTVVVVVAVTSDKLLLLTISFLITTRTTITTSHICFPKRTPAARKSVIFNSVPIISPPFPPKIKSIVQIKHDLYFSCTPCMHAQCICIYV